MLGFLRAHSESTNPPSVTYLRDQQIADMQGRKGHQVECISGHVWVTQDNDLRDIVLASGQNFTFDRSGRVLIHALENASFRIQSGGAVAAKPVTVSQRTLAPKAPAGCPAY